MNIPNEAVEAAAEALYEFRYENRGWDEAKNQDIWRANALVALESAAPYLIKQRRLESRAMRAEANRLWAEQARQDKAEAWNEGWQAQWEAEMTGRECRPNPYELQEAGPDDDSPIPMGMTAAEWERYVKSYR